jgi:hypothetical protein
VRLWEFQRFVKDSREDVFSGNNHILPPPYARKAPLTLKRPEITNPCRHSVNTVYLSKNENDRGVEMHNSRKMQLYAIPGILLILSGITHVTQLFIYPPEGHVVGAALFGGAYFFIGMGILVKRNLTMYWLGAVLPTIGGILGVYRFLILHPNPFSVFHVGIDLIVIPICIYFIRLIVR